MLKTFAVIRSCRLTVIELTEKGVGLGIEAGYAYAQGIPVMTIAQEGTDISSTLQSISQDVCLYRGVDDLRVFFTRLSGNRTT